MGLSDLVSEAAAAAEKVAAGLSTEHRTNATPCSEYDVHDLVVHMAGFYAGSAIAAAKGERPSGGDTADLLGDDPSAALVDLVGKMAEAWAAEGALDGSTQFGPGRMAAEMAASITVLETLVHGWDLARATGQDFEVSESLADASLATAQIICNNDARANGFFGPAVEIPPGAETFDRTLALSGRDPNWSPG